jgi:hypothetical protein
MRKYCLIFVRLVALLLHSNIASFRFVQQYVDMDSGVY